MFQKLQITYVTFNHYADLSDHLVLSTLANIRLTQFTNYPLSDDYADLSDHLFTHLHDGGKFYMPPLPDDYADLSDLYVISHGLCIDLSEDIHRYLELNNWLFKQSGATNCRLHNT